MFNFLNNFKKHPLDHNMTYYQHFKRAINMSLKLSYASICLIIHAIYPDFFKTTASDIIKTIYINDILPLEK